MLHYDRDAFAQAVESGEDVDEDGVEDAFELLTETSEAVRTGGDLILPTGIFRALLLVASQSHLRKEHKSSPSSKCWPPARRQEHHGSQQVPPRFQVSRL
jgi:hypothetical protein